eukprot:NODE_30955_length_407_cov_0.828571.p1 GENE.NODE_30955_length_407_cov_0.828571~~NODE_30955_length_407_cov_0.828571.p1  ORF type:complete len:74 (+),score=2.13 NODE_30955_length_407_cov_0.828571:147-368(+)
MDKPPPLFFFFFFFFLTLTARHHFSNFPMYSAFLPFSYPTNPYKTSYPVFLFKKKNKRKKHINNHMHNKTTYN